MARTWWLFEPESKLLHAYDYDADRSKINQSLCGAKDGSMDSIKGIKKCKKCKRFVKNNDRAELK